MQEDAKEPQKDGLEKSPETTQAKHVEPQEPREGDFDEPQMLETTVRNNKIKDQGEKPDLREPPVQRLEGVVGGHHKEKLYQPFGESVACPEHMPPQCAVCVRRPILSFSNLLEAQPDLASPVPVVDIDCKRTSYAKATKFTNVASYLRFKMEGASTWSEAVRWKVRWFTYVLRPNQRPVVLPVHTPHVFLSLGWTKMPGARGSFAFRLAFAAPGGGLHGCVEGPEKSPGLAPQENHIIVQPLARLDLNCLGKAAVSSVAVFALAQTGSGSSGSNQSKVWPWCAARSLHVRLIRGGHWAAEAPGGGPVPAVRDAEEVHAYLPLTGEDYCGLDAGDMLQVATLGRSAAGRWHFARNVQKIKAEVSAEPYREPEPYRPPPLPPMGNLPPQQQQHQQEFDVATMYMKPSLRANSAHFYRN
uniref:Uncharacterized protein n=1 Tax=Zooxanthella nutricula TaxID=1333877 RepID=A0A7S2J9R2_9DINO